MGMRSVGLRRSLASVRPGSRTVGRAMLQVGHAWNGIERAPREVEDSLARQPGALHEHVSLSIESRAFFLHACPRFVELHHRGPLDA